MAEAVAAVSLVASIAQLIDFSSRVVSRLIEYQRVKKEAPKGFAALRTKLPLILDALKRISTYAARGGVDNETKLVLTPVITSCQQEISSMNGLLEKRLPLPNDSVRIRGRKALQSIRQEKEVEKINKNLTEYLTVLLLHSSTGATEARDFIGTAMAKFMVPFERDNTHIERTDIIQQMDEVFQGQHRVVLAGAGGVGKSQIAIEYCYRFHEQHDSGHVFWIHASTMERAMSDWNQMARLLEIPGINEPEADVLQLTSNYLSDTNPISWLLVLDNVDDADVLFHTPTTSASQNASPKKNVVSCLPKSKRGTILVTSRDRRVGERLVGKKATITVPTFGPEEAQILLRSRLSGLDWDEDNAVKLARELDCLPLAVNQAAAFISENNMHISDYLTTLQAEGDEIKTLLDQETYDVRRDEEMQMPVLRTWRLSFDLIGKQNPRAIEILGLMAVLDRQCLPRSLFDESRENIVQLYLALGILQAFSIISVEKSGGTFRMHRLVQVAVEAWLAERGSLQQCQAEALTMLVQQFPTDGGEFKYWNECEALTPHAQVIFGYQYASDTSQNKLAELLRAVALYDKGQGRYGEARRKLCRAVEIKEGILGAEHLELADYQTALAAVLLERAEYRAAEDLFRTVYNSRKKALGPDHTLTLMSLGSLGTSFYFQGRYLDMKSVQQQALDIAGRILGEDSPITARIMSDLANANSALGDFDNAAQLRRQANSVRSQTVGDTHMESYAVKRRFASSLKDRGNHKEAETIYRELWAARGKSLGSHHPETLKGACSVIDSLSYQGQNEEAEELARHVLQLRCNALPPNHPHILDSMDSLVSVMESQGKYEEAERLCNDVIEIRARILGPDHPHTLCSMIDLYSILCRQDRYNACEELCRKVLDIRSRTLGLYHPDTLESMYTLSCTLMLQKKFSEALEVGRRMLAQREEAQGVSHPDTLESMDNVVRILRALKQEEEATEMLRRALVLGEQRFGEKDADTLVRMTELADLVEIQGMADEALQLYQRALSLYEQTLGKDAESTKECASRVADLLAEKMAGTAI